MNKTIFIIRWLGIDIKMHWSFLFLFIIVGITSFVQGYSLKLASMLILLLLISFVFVLLHEYGHALSARKFGIQTRDIILTPIGGIARLESIPTKPLEELVVAFAGPLVNLFFGIIILTGLYLFDKSDFILRDKVIEEVLFNPLGLAYMVGGLNIILFVFNLIPAYPMDGGRILRSLLSFKFERDRATLIASFIGQMFAIGFIFLGFFNKIIGLILIGLFIYIMASREFHVSRMRIRANKD